MKQLIILVALTATLLAGCSASTEPSATTEAPESSAATSTPASTPTPTPTHTPTASVAAPVDHGHIPKAVGEPGGFTDQVGDPILDFTLTEIRRNFDTCQTSVTPVNDELVGLHFESQTYPNWNENFTIGLNFYYPDFQAFRADGSRVNDPIGNGAGCASWTDAMPTDIGQSQSASGWIVLDLPADTVSVAWVPTAYTEGTGWEWQLE